MLKSSDLIKLFQTYIDDSPLESDNFLEGLDVTNQAAVDLLNDILLYAIQVPLIIDDTTDKVHV